MILASGYLLAKKIEAREPLNQSPQPYPAALRQLQLDLSEA